MSVIQLQEYVIERVFYTVDAQSETTFQTGFLLNYVDQLSETKPEGKVRVGVQIKSETSEVPVFECQALGTFVLMEENAYEALSPFPETFLKTAFSILYGMIRALAIQISATAPKGKLMLPLIDPTAIVLGYLAETASQTPTQA